MTVIGVNVDSSKFINWNAFSALFAYTLGFCKYVMLLSLYDVILLLHESHFQSEQKKHSLLFCVFVLKDSIFRSSARFNGTTKKAESWKAKRETENNHLAILLITLVIVSISNGKLFIDKQCG